ncbi:MAG: hypothetical protein JXA39_08425, partial [Bacteroidales bacterium]|nr:hypothetical protein [Bacteroidales bacterium]
MKRLFTRISSFPTAPAKLSEILLFVSGFLDYRNRKPETGNRKPETVPRQAWRGYPEKQQSAGGLCCFSRILEFVTKAQLWTNSGLPSAYCLLLTAYCLLPTAYC